MRNMLVAAAGILCLAVHGAHADGFEEQARQISRKVSGAAQDIRKDLAASRARMAGALSPADALDEATAGVAAKFVFISSGEFWMGSPVGEEGGFDDEILHRVTLTRGFELQATAVTQLQYFLVTGLSPSVFNTREYCDKDNFKALNGLGLCLNHPVEYVSWDEARVFIARLNGSQDKCAYRLPTEAEREYAARGGMPSRFPYSFGFNGSGELNEYGWYNGNSNKRTHAVATRKANPFGLYDMHGNVWEWTQDWYGEYSKTAATNPPGPVAGSLRVIRGGSWSLDAGYLRSAGRNNSLPGAHWYDVGFRLARTCR